MRTFFYFGLHLSLLAGVAWGGLYLMAFTPLVYFRHEYPLTCDALWVGSYFILLRPLNTLFLYICGIPKENKDYHEEDRKREEAEREKMKNADRGWFGKLIDRLRR